MTQPGYRHRILLLDRSYSIRMILAGQQGGLAEFLGSEQQVPGKATYSLWDFDHEIRCLHSLAPLTAVQGYVITPRGNTALYDAAGTAVTEEGRKLAALPEDQRPEDVTLIISSDGQNNITDRYTGPEARALLEHQRDAYGWRVIFLGTGMDAFAEGEKLGATAALTVNYVNTDDGTANAWSATSGLLSRAPVAMAAAGGYQFSERERKLGQSGQPRKTP